MRIGGGRIMFRIESLHKAEEEAVLLVNSWRIDTFAFRKFFERDLSQKEKGEILEYLKSKIQKENQIYAIVKTQIDNQEFLTTDYYVNPFPRKFRGSYAPVVYKTLGGIMGMMLLQQQY